MNTSTYLRLPATAVWAVLLLATLITWLLGAGHAILVDNATIATVFVVLIAFIKVDLVGRYFMELNHAPRRLAFLFHGWTLITASVVISIYLLH
jgi:amino acid transporter